MNAHTDFDRSPCDAMTAHDWIDHLDLEAHPEGGWYAEVHRTDDVIAQAALPDRFTGDRNAAALIYFLLTPGTYSALHRIQQDEFWHFLAGDGLTLHEITPEGDHRTQRLGCDPRGGRALQAVIPARSWFGATVDAPGPATPTSSGRETGGHGYALVGCTTAPAFDFEDFELADREVLLQQYPQHRAVIERLTPA